MRHTIAMTCVLALLSVPSWALQAAPASGKQGPAQHLAGRDAARPGGAMAAQKPRSSQARGQGRSKPPAAVPAAMPPVEAAVSPAAPPLPATLMNTPPVKPMIQLEHGLLTIDAPNCVLSDVLNGVAAATGATIEGASPGERVAVRLGPGDARAILAALLRGTPYNYILLGSQTDPHAVTHILVIRSEQAPASARSPATSYAPQPEPPRPAAQPAPPSPPGEESPFLQPQEAAGEHPAAEPEEPKPAANKPPPNPNTPEELFRQLQHPFQPQQKQGAQ